MKTLLAEPVLAHTCELGESPVWDAANNRIYWVDILNGTLHWYNESDLTTEQFAIGQEIGAVALAGDHRLVAALKNGFYLIDPEEKSILTIAETEAGIITNRFNDGKCDPAGRFWAGSMSVIGEPDAGTLYMLDHGGQVFERIGKVGCSNGLAWSPDCTMFYFIDTLSCQVVAYDFDVESGAIWNRRSIIYFNPAEGLPDGMTIDSEGMLWIAMWNGSNVSRYNPSTGQLLSRIMLPVSQVTSCTFGGPALSDLYITTARTGLSDRELGQEPLAGSLFVVRDTGFSGLPVFEFLG